MQHKDVVKHISNAIKKQHETNVKALDKNVELLSKEDIIHRLKEKRASETDCSTRINAVGSKTEVLKPI